MKINMTCARIQVTASAYQPAFGAQPTPEDIHERAENDDNQGRKHEVGRCPRSQSSTVKLVSLHVLVIPHHQ